MPKFSVPWGKKKGGSSGSVIHGGSSGSEQSKPGAQIFNKDNSVAVFGQTISLEDEEEGGEQGGETDETVDNVLGLLPSESCCPSMSLKYVCILFRINQRLICQRIMGFLGCLLMGLVLCCIVCSWVV
jgi:hypothetical protein